MPNGSFQGLRPRIPRNLLTAFGCCFVSGFLAHLYAFTNLIPNADGLSRVYDAQQMTVAGRWFLHYASVFHGYVQAPAVIGFFTVLFLSLSAALTVSLLKIRNPVLCGLTGLLMAVFPPVAFTLLFLFTSSAYCFGILLAVLSVWMTARRPRLLIPAILVLACAVGTYQAYFAAAAALSLISVLLFALEEKRKTKEVLLYGLRFLVLLTAGLLVYYGELLIFLKAKNLTLMDYKGISGIGRSGLAADALSRLGAAYTELIPSYSTPLILGVNLALAAVGLWAFAVCAVRDRLHKRPAVLVLTIVLLSLLPPALNFAVLLVSRVRDHMRYALVFAYVLVLALTERAVSCHQERSAAEPKDPSSSAPEPVAPWALVRNTKLLFSAVTILSVLLAILSFQVDNLAYTASDRAHRATLSFATRLVSRVESAPGYREGMEVVVIGSLPESAPLDSASVFDTVDAPSYSVLNRNKHIYYYVNDWLNVLWREPDEETFLTVSDSDTFLDMPLYPDDGSVVVKDNRVIVKLAEYYTPKKDYEKQYESRR